MHFVVMLIHLEAPAYCLLARSIGLRVKSKKVSRLLFQKVSKIFHKIKTSGLKISIFVRFQTSYRRHASQDCKNASK